MELLTTQQLSAVGNGQHEISALIATGRLMRVARGHYTRGSIDDHRMHHELQVAACADRMAANAVISHESAALLHGLPLPPGAIGPVRLIRPRRAGGGRSNSAVRVHRLDLVAEDITQVSVHLRNVPVTTLARTVIDLACASLPWGLAAADVALNKGISRELLAQIAKRQVGRTGAARARQLARYADERAESPAESLSRAHLLLAGLPQPELQYQLVDAAGRFVARTDFGWPAFRLVGECDGLAKYEDPRTGSVREVLRREKAREAAIRQLGWGIVRWTYDEIFDPQRMAHRVATALHRQGWSAGSCG